MIILFHKDYFYTSFTKRTARWFFFDANPAFCLHQTRFLFGCEKGLLMGVPILHSNSCSGKMFLFQFLKQNTSLQKFNDTLKFSYKYSDIYYIIGNYHSMRRGAVFPAQRESLMANQQKV